MGSFSADEKMLVYCGDFLIGDTASDQFQSSQRHLGSFSAFVKILLRQGGFDLGNTASIKIVNSQRAWRENCIRTEPSTSVFVQTSLPSSSPTIILFTFLSSLALIQSFIMPSSRFTQFVGASSLVALVAASTVPDLHLLGASSTRLAKRDVWPYGVIGDSWGSGVSYKKDVLYDDNLDKCLRTKEAHGP